jgi:hypothetical protein
MGGANPSLARSLTCSARAEIQYVNCVARCGMFFAIRARERTEEELLEMLRDFVRGALSDFWEARQRLKPLAQFYGIYFAGMGGILTATGGMMAQYAGLAIVPATWAPGLALAGAILFVVGAGMLMAGIAMAMYGFGDSARDDFDVVEQAEWLHPDQIPGTLPDDMDQIREAAALAVNLARGAPALIRSIERMDALSGATGLSPEEIVGHAADQIGAIRYNTTLLAHNLDALERLVGELNKMWAESRSRITADLAAHGQTISPEQIRRRMAGMVNTDLPQLLANVNMAAEEVDQFQAAAAQAITAASTDPLGREVLIDPEFLNVTRPSRDALRQLDAAASAFRLAP